MLSIVTSKKCRKSQRLELLWSNTWNWSLNLLYKTETRKNQNEIGYEVHKLFVVQLIFSLTNALLLLLSQTNRENQCWSYSTISTIAVQFRYETFYYLWVKGFDIRREAQYFSTGFFLCPTAAISCGTCHKDLREQTKTNRLPPRQVSSQVTFSKSPKILRALTVRDVIRTR